MSVGTPTGRAQTLRRRLALAGFVLAVAALAGCRPADVSAPGPGTVRVDARDNLFSPETATVAMGKFVRWTNQGRDLHSVVTSLPGVQSNLLPPGSWFEARFDSAGTFGYRCSRHAQMTGVVIVR